MVHSSRTETNKTWESCHFLTGRGANSLPQCNVKLSHRTKEETQGNISKIWQIFWISASQSTRRLSVHFVRARACSPLTDAMRTYLRSRRPPERQMLACSMRSSTCLQTKTARRAERRKQFRHQNTDVPLFRRSLIQLWLWVILLLPQN